MMGEELGEEECCHPENEEKEMDDSAPRMPASDRGASVSSGHPAPFVYFIRSFISCIVNQFTENQLREAG